KGFLQSPKMSNSRYQNVYPFSIMFAYPGEPITLYVFEILRLGRSFLGMLNMAPSLEESGTRVWSLSPTESRSRIDDTKLRDLMPSIFSWVADRKRENLIERTKLGIARAKAEGVTFGRPKRIILWKRVQDLQEKFHCGNFPDSGSPLYNVVPA